MIDYSLILAECYNGKSWTIKGESYSGLTWNDESKKPTQKELDALWEDAKTIVEARAQAKINARQSALNKLMALGLTEEEALALGVK